MLGYLIQLQNNELAMRLPHASSTTMHGIAEFWNSRKLSLSELKKSLMARFIMSSQVGEILNAESIYNILNVKGKCSLCFYQRTQRHGGTEFFGLTLFFSPERAKPY